ncbi:unnamed protein product [Schistosoma margrebowiei]|uniref:Uncharacterized protein n=1 Tax=Schistosoma margrebowiei TaxID=48269 RepID=A0A183M8B8_9TREM|nr:unnamed protein product [Schistosoma margrebowiei]
MQLDDLEFADRLALLPHTNQQIQVKTTSVATVCAAVGFNIHKRKTKIFKYNTENTDSITFDGETVEEMGTLTYLDSIIAERVGSGADLTLRIGKVRTAFLQLKNICNSKQLSTNIKLRIFNTNIKIVLLYEVEDTKCPLSGQHQQQITMKENKPASN